MTRWLRTLSIVVLLLTVAPSLACAACATPRQAMATFLDNLQPDQDRPDEAIVCFDWSGGPAGRDARVMRARELKAVLDGKGLFVDYASVPDDPGYTDTGTGLARATLFPAQADIFLARVDARWLISRATVQATPGLLKATYVLPLQRMAQRLPAAAHNEVLGIEMWSLSGLLILAILAFVIARILEIVSSATLKQVVGRFFEVWSEEFAQQIVRRGSWIIIAGILAALVPSLGLPVRLNQVIYIAMRLLASTAAVLISMSLVDLLADALQRRADQTDTKMDDQLIPLLRRAIKMLVVAIGSLFVLQNLSVDVSSLLGSLAIGGLAFSLAAKDTLANLFGSLTIFTDQPFQIGDVVTISGIDGVVEEVGFRSTRIRTFYDSVVTIPNNSVANASIDNMGRRRYRRFKATVGLTYDTTAEQMEAFVSGVRKSIEDNEFTRKDSFEVHFHEMSASSLDILVYCFFETATWTDELRGRQQLMLAWMHLAREVGVEFAFPTQTLHLEGLEKATA